MNRTSVRVGAFLLGLALVFGAAVAVGRAVGPIDQPEPAAHAEDAGHDSGSDEHGGHDPAAASLPDGLAVSDAGFTLRLDRTSAPAGRGVPLSFSIEGPDGAAVTEYDVEHEKRLHLIVVRRDGSGFQHVHPTMAADGTWRTRLALTPGVWRVFADFNPLGGVATTLGADLFVAGDHRPVPPPPVSRTAEVDGYTVTLDGHLEPGTEARLVLTVTRDGRPVTDLEPYLGAYGHLVALREGDLAYLHVHPDGHPGDGVTEPGPEVVFAAEVPSPGRYLLFLDFRHGGRVHTAPFVVDTREAHS
jgi:hypothetical protein